MKPFPPKHVAVESFEVVSGRALDDGQARVRLVLLARINGDDPCELSTKLDVPRPGAPPLAPRELVAVAAAPSAADPARGFPCVLLDASEPRIGSRARRFGPEGSLEPTTLTAEDLASAILLSQAPLRSPLGLEHLRASFDVRVPGAKERDAHFKLQLVSPELGASPAGAVAWGALLPFTFVFDVITFPVQLPLAWPLAPWTYPEEADETRGVTSLHHGG